LAAKKTCECSRISRAKMFMIERKSEKEGENKRISSRKVNKREEIN